VHADTPNRHSIAQSITTFKRPYALLFDANGQIEDYATVSFQSQRPNTHLLRPYHNLGIDRALFGVISTIAVFISDLTNWYDTGTCPVDSLDLQKHASLLMYRLFDWYNRNQNLVDVSNKDADECICLASLIFMVIATDNTGSFGSRLSKVTTKLYITLQRVSVQRWSTAPDLLFWTLTKHGRSRREKPPQELPIPDSSSPLSVIILRAVLPHWHRVRNMRRRSLNGAHEDLPLGSIDLR
jgi:hypothetical protein